MSPEYLLLPIVDLVVQKFLERGYHGVRYSVRNYFHGKKTEKLREFLAAMGASTPDQIRSLVEACSSFQDMNEQQREEVSSVLINLHSGAGFLTTHGAVRSSFIRSEKVLDLLLSNIETRKNPATAWPPASSGS
ncbi:MAG: hypothetical protein R3C49_00125 [Planctomycetaceae bacterium]